MAYMHNKDVRIHDIAVLAAMLFAGVRSAEKVVQEARAIEVLVTIYRCPCDVPRSDCDFYELQHEATDEARHLCASVRLL